MQYILRSFVLALSIVCLGEPALALKFEVVPDLNGRRVLFIHDCGTRPSDYDDQRKSTCKEYEKSFSGAGVYPAPSGRKENYRGDAAVLRDRLRSENYDEVWFFSGGGDLQEGVEVGRVLRAQHMTVRVPGTAQCISSCTVAFMGGMFRYMDPGAKYQVHSASRVLEEIPEDTRALLNKGDFTSIARKAQISARFRAIQLLTHFQNTLLIPLKTSRPENDDSFYQWAVNRISPLPYSQLEEDRQRYRSEGDAAAQDILMRIERDAMQWAIREIRSVLPDLGRRAEPALKMVEAMYDVSIKETAILTKETMLRMGYLTQDLQVEPRR